MVDLTVLSNTSCEDLDITSERERDLLDPPHVYGLITPMSNNMKNATLCEYIKILVMIQ